MKDFVKKEVFQAMQNVDVKALNALREKDLRPVLPCLVRMALCKPLDESDLWTRAKKDVLKILSGIEVVNSIVALLSIDFHALEQDVNKEQQLRTKLGGSQSESILISQLQNGVSLEFERSDPARRLRLLLSELLFVTSQMRESKSEFYQKSSELFESLVYLEEVSDVLCIAQAELPALLPITEVAETLLHIPNGDWMLCRLVANSPDCFREVCRSLVSKGEKQDEETTGGRRRMEVLLTLAKMNPFDSYNIRAMCVENCTMPGLAVALTLEMNKTEETDSSESCSDVVGFVSGMLLGNDPSVKEWFSQYVKIGQKLRRDSSVTMLHNLRLCLLEQMIAILPDNGGTLSESQAIQASSFIRLYCTLKSMAAFKFTDEEMKLLLRLITSRPPLSKAGARFVSLGLCMLIACPYLLGNSDQEKMAIDWIKWSMQMEKEFKMEVGSNCSFGEMLFLIAIHFHSNNMSAISDLVYLTIGLKGIVKANALARLRQIFTSEIFTEQVITSHAVKVPVTPSLNATMTGYLPINSIYQLLKSRSFSKHKVPIKDWIYQQISHCSCPVHPLVPPLIEVYVNSIVVKSTKTDHLNEPITDEEILNVYKSSVFHWSRENIEDQMEEGKPEAANLAPQLLILFYLLLYEDTVLSNMKSIVSVNRKMKSYPDTVLAQIPINFLLQTAQKQQQQYAGLFSPLLKLLVTHYPHLCAVEDWLEESLIKTSSVSESATTYKASCSINNFNDALRNLTTCPMKMTLQLQQMLNMEAPKLLQFADSIVSSLPIMLDEEVPRKIVDLIKKVWFLLHGVSPRSLRLATVNALRITERTTFRVTPYTENDITVDPLIILRCDERIFRCPPILDILLRVLAAYLQASRVYLHNHMQSNPVMDTSGQSERERLDLKNALIAAQESAVIQILLECCLPTETDDSDAVGLLNNKREVQCIICSFIHQLFISEPHLAKLVHFQGYPDVLLPITIAGIPSIHICLDFIPEILSQPQPEKQIFAIKMMSYLCCQYALPKSLSIAKLCINVMFTMIGVLENKDRVDFFIETIPSLMKVCQAFPPLCEDVTSILHQVGRVCMSHITASSNLLASENSNMELVSKYSYSEPLKKKLKLDLSRQELTSKYQSLYHIVQRTFADVVVKSLVTKNIYA